MNVANSATERQKTRGNLLPVDSNGHAPTWLTEILKNSAVASSENACQETIFSKKLFG